MRSSTSEVSVSTAWSPSMTDWPRRDVTAQERVGRPGQRLGDEREELYDLLVDEGDPRDIRCHVTERLPTTWTFGAECRATLLSSHNVCSGSASWACRSTRSQGGDDEQYGAGPRHDGRRSVGGESPPGRSPIRGSSIRRPPGGQPQITSSRRARTVRQAGSSAPTTATTTRMRASRLISGPVGLSVTGPIGKLKGWLRTTGRAAP